MSSNPVTPPSVVLCTLNARYIHAALGLRYLRANMGALRAVTALREFTISRDPAHIVQELLELLGPELAERQQVIGFGVYIWNVTQTCEVLRRLRQRRPRLRIVLGGPEVSHEWEQQQIVALADHLITGWGDVSFPKLCQALLHGPQPLMKVIAGEQPLLDALVLPYQEYSDADLAHRILYIEASRGCPFKCAFCLSSLDKTAWAFDLDRLLAELDTLFVRGARTFKFVDRTFNLKIDASVRILQFFLDHLALAGPAGLFVHFEVIPDHLPERLQQMIALFPAGVLQFEVGIQSFNPVVQQVISRRQDNDRTEANLRWLVTRSQAHLHADLIFGLPGEDLPSFAHGFDRLYALGPHEIQLGLLKRLRGTPIGRLTQAYGMEYDDAPPYAVRQSAAVSAQQVQAFGRMARYWELVANSGRFQRSLVLLLGTHGEPLDVVGGQHPDERPAAVGNEVGDERVEVFRSGRASPFAAFWRFSAWLWQRAGQTGGITPETLVDRLFEYLHGHCGHDADLCREALLADYQRSGARARPDCLRGVWPADTRSPAIRQRALATRQQQHRPLVLAAGDT
ncbi:MAG: radical SAM protein [Betaproteobacteria bacterium]